MSGRPNDDLFEGTKMSFGQHLEELRVVLFRALFGLVIGMVVGLVVAKHVVLFIQTPLTSAMEDYFLKRAIDDIHKKFKDSAEPEMMEMIVKEGVVPDFMRVELAEFYDIITRHNDDIPPFKPYRFISEDVLPDSEGIPKYVQLCRRLVSDGKGKEGTPGKRLWLLMSSKQEEPDPIVGPDPMVEPAPMNEPNPKAAPLSQQELLEALNKKKSFDRKDVRNLVTLLNDLIDLPQLHQSKEFTNIKFAKEESFNLLDPSTWFAGETKTDEAFRLRVDSLRERFKRARKADRKIDPDRSRRLNRILMSVVYPELLRRPRVQLIDLPTWKPVKIRVQTLNAQEAFMIWLKAGLISALVMTSPWIFWQIWMFVGSGLYPHEKRYVYIFLPFSLTLFLSGTALAFFFVFKPVLNFLFGFNAMMDIDPDPRISEWMSFVMFLPIGFGIAFQLPLVMLFLNRIGLFSVEVYLQKWRIAILVIFVISMLLTPADPISMLLMACPLTLLYFLGVALCKWMPRGRSPFSEAYEP